VTILETLETSSGLALPGRCAIVPQTKATKGGRMAQRRGESKDLLNRLADAGEVAIQRLGEVPGGKKVMDAVSGLRDRVDELQKRVRALGDLEKRVKALERKVGTLEKPKPARKAAARKPGAKKAAPKMPKQAK
jgi:hypothetical protein